jgi:predicted phosphate transport protein (TIGR00153 family)
MRTINPLTSLFGKSPFGPLKEHMNLVSECAALMVPLFEAVAANDRERVEENKQKIFELEKLADEVKNEIRVNLHWRLFLPVDRGDLLQLLKTQDSIADRVQDVAALIFMGKLSIPESQTERLMSFVHLNLDATHQCKEIISQLDDLLEVGFRGKAVERVEEMIKKLSSIETECDDVGLALTGGFLLGGDREPLTTSKLLWLDVIRKLGNIADKAENVGDSMRLLIAR